MRHVALLVLVAAQNDDPPDLLVGEEVPDHRPAEGARTPRYEHGFARKIAIFHRYADFTTKLGTFKVPPGLPQAIGYGAGKGVRTSMRKRNEGDIAARQSL